MSRTHHSRPHTRHPQPKPSARQSKRKERLRLLAEEPQTLFPLRDPEPWKVLG